mmetsp:Transcript_45640/g.83577  ORF Transcript_45640/g.83577 Transcript_45640/m.83577 type:complete len:256 (+) Transcript_45640:77-844(+)
MGEEGQPPTKRMRIDEPPQDLTIIFEDGTTCVSSMLLMYVSPVFRQMLNSGMIESQTRQISLPGKKKDEFLSFMKVIEPCSKTGVTVDTVGFLSRWADEYGVEGLKATCEDELMKQPITVVSLQHALECNLPRRTEQCYVAILKSLPTYINDLAGFGSSFPEPMLQRLWPAMCKAAGVEPQDMTVPEPAVLERLLPFVSAAIHRSEEVRSKSAKCTCGALRETVPPASRGLVQPHGSWRTTRQRFQPLLVLGPLG